MQAAPTRPTLLSAARNFIRKSAGTAVLAIAPLAAVGVAPEANAVVIDTTFGSPGLNIIGPTSGAAFVSGGIFSESTRFAIPGGAVNNVTTTRIGVNGDLIASSPGNGSVTTLHFFSSVNDADIAGSLVLPVTYAFTLSKQAGSIGAVNWTLKAGFTGDGPEATIGTGMLGSGQGTATFTGTGSYTTTGVVAADINNDFNVILYLSYSMAIGDHLFVGMNSASQGITLNAAAIPEPSTYAAVLGVATLGLAFIRRTRRVRAS